MPVLRWSFASCLNDDDDNKITIITCELINTLAAVAAVVAVVAKQAAEDVPSIQRNHGLYSIWRNATETVRSLITQRHKLITNVIINWAEQCFRMNGSQIFFHRLVRVCRIIFCGCSFRGKLSRIHHHLRIAHTLHHCWRLRKIECANNHIFNINPFSARKVCSI